MTRNVSLSLQDWPIVLEPKLQEHVTTDLRMQEFDTVFPDRLRESTRVTIRPETPLDALMQCAPGNEPEESLIELQVLREAIADCIEKLSEQDQFIVNAIHSERISIADLGKRLGVSKTHSDRLIKAATDTLKRHLLTHPLIRERLNMPDAEVIELRPTTWNAAARRAVLALAPVGVELTDLIAESLIDRKIGMLRELVRGGHIANEPLGQPLVTIGRAAADMLSTRGLWDVEAIVDLLCRKQYDYGHGNILAFGMVGVVVRCSDKVARWSNLASKGSSGSAEPAIDALLDMVGYAVIAHMLMEGTFELRLAEDYVPEGRAA